MTTDWAQELAECRAALKTALGIGSRGPGPGQSVNAH